MYSLEAFPPNILLFYRRPKRHLYITKTRLFKYIENFITKKCPKDVRSFTVFHFFGGSWMHRRCFQSEVQNTRERFYPGFPPSVFLRNFTREKTYYDFLFAFLSTSHCEKGSSLKEKNLLRFRLE